MPNEPFDRTIINPQEKPLSKDVNIYLAQVDRALRFFAKSLFSTTTGAPVSGFSQGGFRAAESGPQAMSVVLKAGLGFQDLPGDVPTNIDGVLGLNDLESYKPLVLTADLTVAIPTAPPAPNSRIDIIEVRADRLKADNQSRQVFNNTTKAFSPTAVDKTLEFLLDGSKLGAVVGPAPSTAAVSLKQGIAGTPGVAPAATVGYLKIAEVFVDGDVILIDQSDVTDTRKVLTEGLSKLNYPAQVGRDVALVSIPQEGGAVDVLDTGVYSVPFGQGLEAGDIVEDIVMVWQKINGTLSSIATQVWLNTMDLDAETASLALYSTSNTDVETVQKVRSVSQANGPFTGGGPYPFVWTAGMAATMRVGASGATERFHSIYVLVRRPVFFQDTP